MIDLSWERLDVSLIRLLSVLLYHVTFLVLHRFMISLECIDDRFIFMKISLISKEAFPSKVMDKREVKIKEV